VLIGGLIGIVYGYSEIRHQWYARLEAIGIDREALGGILTEYLGKKRVLETVESNQLVEEFCWVTRLLAE
jgi:hypothetical protein